MQKLFSQSSSLRKPATIHPNDLIRHIRGLHHPHNRLCNLIRAPITANRNSFIPDFSKIVREGKDHLASCLLFANSWSSPGSIFVSPINAGATPFTVIPFLAYAPASQWIRPCNADFEDLFAQNTVSSVEEVSKALSRARRLRVVRPHHAPSKARNAAAEDHSSPPFLLHGRYTELRQQKGRAAICAPCPLEVIDG